MSNESEAPRPVVAEPSRGPTGIRTSRSGLAAVAGLGLLTLGMFGQVLFGPGERVLSNWGLDVFLQFIPWRQFGFDQLRQGNLALWNPHIFSGAPFFGGFQSALLYPPNVLFLVLPVGTAVNWSIALHVFLAGAFTYGWTARRGLHPLACFLSAVMFMFCGAHFPRIYAGHLPNLCTLVWAPLLFLAIDGLFERPSLGWGLLGMFALAMQVLAGHPQYVFYTGVAAALYSVLCVGKATDRKWFLLGLAGILAGGIGLSAVQLFTGLAESRETLRSSGLPYGLAASYSFPPENFLTLLAPHILGDTKSVSYWGRCYFWEASFFVSVTGVVLAAVGAIGGERHKRRFALVMAAVMIVLALGGHTPLFKFLYHYAPGFDKFRGSAKFLFMASLFVALLAGIGLDRLLQGLRVSGRWSAGIAGMAVVMAAAALWVQESGAGGVSAAGTALPKILLAVNGTGETMLPGAVYKDPAFVLKASTCAAGSLWTGAVTLAALAALLFLARIRPRTAPLLVALAVVELFWFAHGSLDTCAPSEMVDSGMRQFLREHPGDDRIINAVNPNTAMMLGAQNIWGYDPGVMRRYAEFIFFTQGKDPEQATYSTVVSEYHPLYAMLRCRFQFAQAMDRVAIGEATNAMPRLQLVSRFRVIPRREDIFAALTNAAFNPREEVILETAPAPEPHPTAHGGTVKLLNASTDDLTLEAEVPSPSLLLVTDAYAKGWRAEPLGGTVQSHYQVLPANYCLRAIPLGAGHHHLRLEYRPSCFCDWKVGFDRVADGLPGAVSPIRQEAAGPKRGLTQSMTTPTPSCGTQSKLGDRAVWARCLVLGPVCALVIGIFALSARSGLLEAQAARADDTYYNLLVRALRAGQLNLPREVPAGFAQLADPYDPAANEHYRWLERPTLHDLSYYKGKLYLYFGITPALVLLGPYAALTGRYLLHKDAVVIFYSVGFLTSAGLLWGMWRRYFAEVGLGVIAAGTLALGLASFLPMTLPRCDVYEVAISCGYALMMLALAGIWGALHQPRRRGWWLAAASLACGLAVGARPSLLFGAAILLVPVARAWRERQPVWVPLLAATGPIALIGLGLMRYNALRFDNPFEFGMHHALASCRMDTVQGFSWRYLGFNLWVYFLAPMHWSTRFPFAHDITLPPPPAGHFGAEHPFGVLTNLPLVWLALAAPLAWRNGSTEGRAPLRGFLAGVAWVFGTCALTLGFFFAACDRYQVEFVPALVLLAVAGILALERTLAGRRIWRLMARSAWGFLLVASVAFNLLASAGRRAGTDVELGSVLLARGQVDEAMAHFRRALAIEPNAAGILVKLGGALLAGGRIEEAVTPLQEALRIQPDSAQAHNHLGTALLQQGRVAEAIAHFRQALKTQPDSAQAHHNLGTALLQQGNADEAIAHLQDAVKLLPSLAGAHHNLGNALLQAGRLDEAIAQLQKALDLQPSLADSHMSLGDALLRQGRVPEAIAHLRKAVELQPGLAGAHHNLGNALFQNGQLDEAAIRFQEALSLQPNFAGAHNGLGNTRLRQGRVPEAIGHFQQAVTLQPGLAEAHLNLANALLQADRVDEAIAHFQKGLALQPNLAGAHCNLGNALLRKGRTDEAIACFQRALALQPSLAEAHNNLANALLQKGRPAEAVEHYQAAVASLPDNPYLLNNLAWVLATSPEASVRDGARAMDLASQADRLAGGKDPAILGTLAAAYAEAGRLSEALATAQRALDLATAQTNSTQVEALRARLKVFQTGSPFRDSDGSPRGGK